MKVLPHKTERPGWLAGPICKGCGGTTRLTHIEPHVSEALTDMRTFRCNACDTEQTISVRTMVGA